MNIYYNDNKNEWYSDCDQPLLFGKKLSPLKRTKQTQGYISFSVLKKANKVGPLIGILTTIETNKNFYGNRAFFRKIQDRFQERGGISFVFTPEGIHENHIEGYHFDSMTWKKFVFPFPDIIYNRIATYHGERGKSIKLVRNFAVNNEIPLYNPHFFDKWKTYQILRKNELLNKYLPETEIVQSAEHFNKWLNKVQTTFIKPVLSNRGEGTFIFSKENNIYKIQTNHWQKQFSFFEEAFDELQLHVASRKMIMQQKISLKKYQGYPYDLRILIQRIKSNWSIIGIGVRCARDGAITTHIPQGGRIIPLHAVSNEIDVDLIDKLVKQISVELELAYGYLCEFSIDLAIDEENHYWILEINSKPMKFDELVVQKKALDTLISCFSADAGFNY